MKWDKKYLADVADFCLGKMLDQKKNRGDFLPYLANLNVQWGEFDLTDLRQMKFESHEIERYGLKYGDMALPSILCFCSLRYHFLLGSSKN